MLFWKLNCKVIMKIQHKQTSFCKGAYTMHFWVKWYYQLCIDKCLQLIEWILLNFSWNLQCKRKVFNIFKMPINFFYTRFILWKSNTMLKSRRFWIFRSTFLIQNKTNKHHHQVSIFELGRKFCFFQYGQFFLGTKFHLIQRFSNFWNKLSKSYFRTKTGQMHITLQSIIFELI